MKLNLRTTAVTLFAIFATAGAMLAATASAQAATSHATAQHLQMTTHAVSPASSCNPKEDFEIDGQWGNTCGFGILYLDNEALVTTLRSPYAPYHRIWFHQNADGSGWAACFYSTGHDIYIPYSYQYPGNILISENTAHC